MNPLPPPLILIGMHRSGTSLFAGLLQDAGVFMGSDLEKNFKSRCFQYWNRWLFRIAHAAWDAPGNVLALLEEPALLERIAGRLRVGFSSERFLQYLGVAKPWWVRTRPVRSLWEQSQTGQAHNHFPARWGWKDPRTTYTLPVWLRIFPQARVLHIYRNGVDVAASLVARERACPDRLADPTASFRCSTLARSFSLWEEYITAGFAAAAALPAQQVRHLRYETLLENPRKELRTLLLFAGLEPDTALLDRLAAQVNPGRGNAFLQDPQLADFYRQVCGSPWMERLGYANIWL